MAVRQATRTVDGGEAVFSDTDNRPYVAGWSLARDIETLFTTVPAVLSGRGAC